MKKEFKCIMPANLGLLEQKLTTEEINYLWKCIENKKESYKHKLAGNIHESYILKDENDWFYQNTLIPLCNLYADQYKNVGKNIPGNNTHPYFLYNFWVNYQRENEFNPIHEHSGIYSFVIWMKIPTYHWDQNRNPISVNSNSPRISSFSFHYTNILGEICEHVYEMSPEMEGTIVFFPSKLNHCVYPFFNCKEERISISGNIALNTDIKLILNEI